MVLIVSYERHKSKVLRIKSDSGLYKILTRLNRVDTIYLEI